MRVLIFSINYWPETTGIGSLITSRAESLARAGHEVEICTGFPYYPEWKIGAGYEGKLWKNEIRNGVRIKRSYIYVPNPVTSIKRIVHEASYLITAGIRALFSRRPDVILAVSPPLGLAAVAILLGKLWGVPYVFDVQDLQPDSALEHGMLPPRVAHMLYRLEAAAYRHARFVTTLTVAMRNQIVAKGFASEKVRLVELSSLGSKLQGSAEDASAFRNKYGLHHETLVTYSGNIGIKQRLDVAMEAADLLRKEENLLFLIVGDGADCARVKKLAADKQLPNVRFLPLLDEEDFRGMLAATDACLVTQQKTSNETAFPSKIVSYYASGCPVIASVSLDGEVARIVAESNAGIAVEAEDPERLAEAVRQIGRLRGQATRDKARAYADRRWSPEQVLKRFEQCLLEAAGHVQAREGTAEVG